MAPDEQLEWERRAGRPAGVAAILAGTLLLAAGILARRAAGDDAFDTYLKIDDDASLILIPNIVQAIGYLLAAYALWYLIRATSARRPEFARSSKVMAVIGPLGTAAALVITALAIQDLASEVASVNPAPRGEEARDDVLADLQGDSGLVTAAAITSFFGRLALGFALLLASLNAIRAGLLSRLVGVLGIISGVLTVLFGGASFFLAFWLAAVGAIALDRWPRGRGPAWETGEATPWPSALDQRFAEAGPEAEAEPEHEDEDEPAGSPHPSSKKRKRKRR